MSATTSCLTRPPRPRATRRHRRSRGLRGRRTVPRSSRPCWLEDWPMCCPARDPCASTSRAAVTAYGPRRVYTDGRRHARQARHQGDRGVDGVSLPGQRRSVLPVYSLMIATEPLPQAFWDEVGWRDRETMTDGRHLLIYAQRTADNRIAFGGRGAPYHFGSRIEPSFDREPGGVRRARAFAGRAVPRRTRRRDHPPLGWPARRRRGTGSARCATTRRSGLGEAGGYVGDGVTTTNLAGRTLADLDPAA